jgi:thiamine-phosphate pyrophosphorylase
MSLDGGKLYLVADDRLSSEALGGVVEAGVDIVQLRMKDALAVDVLREGERFKEACIHRSALFIVNDRPDVALALGSDGVHLGQEDLPPSVARDIIGPRAIIGRSTHSTEDIERAIEEHGEGFCDYIAVGPVYHTPTHPERRAVGLDLLRYASDHVGFPWFAIGGIDATNVAEVLDAGASRICVVRAIVDATDPVAATKELSEAIR